MQSKSTDVLVGLFVIAGLAALLFLALKAGNLASFSTASTYRVHARFDNIGGLKPRAPVKSAGVVVGRVAAVLALLGAIFLVLFLVIGGGSSYTVTAQFQNASQLVTGNNVNVAGVPVGSVAALPAGSSERTR